MGISDKSGTPRSRKEVEAALQAVNERLVDGPRDAFTKHLAVIEDVLIAELRARAGRGE